MQPPFGSTAQLRAAFNTGLLQLAQQEGLGPFILTCANVTFDPGLFSGLEAPLRERFARLANDYVQAFQVGRPVAAVDEDLLVFLKIFAAGFDSLQLTEFRQENNWQVQFNHLRSFRPRRITQNVPDGIAAPFNPDGFHFNRPFMQQECFWRGELAGIKLDLYYNKYPFAPLHGLLVPERAACYPQLLTAEMHDYIWGLAQSLQSALPGVGFGYNGFGAYASVNHLHFQMYVDPNPMPVQDARWVHNSGRTPYPAACVAFAAADAAWDYLTELHEQAQPYNALYLPGQCYIFPRRKQGSVPLPAWSSGFTWYELAGGMLAFNRDDYASLTATTIEAELARLWPE
jgi:hypothetical protein